MSFSGSESQMNFKRLNFAGVLYSHGSILWLSYSDAFIVTFISSACRQSHQSFFGKSDLFFLCIMHPLSFDIQKQDLEIEAAQVRLN